MKTICALLLLLSGSAIAQQPINISLSANCPSWIGAPRVLMYASEERIYNGVRYVVTQPKCVALGAGLRLSADGTSLEAVATKLRQVRDVFPLAGVTVAADGTVSLVLSFTPEVDSLLDLRLRAGIGEVSTQEPVAGPRPRELIISGLTAESLGGTLTVSYWTADPKPVSP